MSSSSPITCHVLNTVTGTPANDLKTTLTFLGPQGTAPGQQSTPSVIFTAMTDKDGRVKEWTPATTTGTTTGGDGDKTLPEVMQTFAPGQKTAWSIRFEVGPWYEARGVESFWPEVEVKFYVRTGERHYHVPVLVGPWTYTTYRGS